MSILYTWTMHKVSLRGVRGMEWKEMSRRWKSRKTDHWANVRRKQTGPALALKHFDHFYPETYGAARWRSIRLALLCRAKPVALLNYYGDAAGTARKLQACGSYDLTAEVRARSARLSPVPASLPSPPPSAGQAEPGPAPAEVLPDAAAETAGRLRVLQPAEDETAALHDYVPASQLYGDDDWLEEGDYFQHYQDDGTLKIAVDPDPPISVPESLTVYSFPAGDISRFPHPADTASGAKDYYPLDAGSLLPVLALDLQPGDDVLDMCAAPGGKTLAILQTLRPAFLTCRDIKSSRLKRLQRVLTDYLPGAGDWPCEVKVARQDGQMLQEREQYDKVLVDVPCFADRHSLSEDENNLFAISRSRERIQIPQLQTNLLRRAVEAVRPGGTVVYSTCTLSPVQNDGVVHMALKMLWEETDVQVVVKDLTHAMRPLFGALWFARGAARYGQQVLPSVVNNFGPTYFAKIVRVK